MTSPRRSTGAGGWVRRGLAVGLAVSAPIPIIIGLSVVLDSLRWAYPLVLLPLLVAGPIAVNGRRGRAAICAAAVAGIVSAVVASVSLAIGMKTTGFVQWGLASASAAPPMPQLPRVSILPMEWMTWPQQDILFFQPILAVVLGLLTRGTVVGLGHLADSIGDYLPNSLGGRLRWTFAALTALTLTVGALSFGMIEEMHYRIHRLQLQASWQRDVSTVRSLLAAELTARREADGAVATSSSPSSAEEIAGIFARLSSPAQKAGISVGADGVAAILDSYRPLLDDAIAAHAAYRASGGDLDRLQEATAALARLDDALEADADDLLRGSDRTHHERLIMVMILVAVVAGIGLWTGERVIDAIVSPLAGLGVHLQRVARGHFTDRVPDGGPREIRTLGRAVNDMSTDLARLYEVERERRAQAEALATREQALSAAKEFWTNTLVHDLKGPLTLIAGWSELLEQGRDSRLDPIQREAIHQLQQATRSLDNLVADINDSFRLQEDALPIRRASIDPGELLRCVVDDYRAPDCSRPEIRIASDLLPVQADARLILRVLHNLIANAYKHAGKQAHVELVAEPIEGAVLFAVDDDGPGIPVLERETIFERFIQGEQTIKRDGAPHGAGLGLAFCKLVVEQLGGHIWADASRIGGARIAFTLPLAPAAQVIRGANEDQSLPTPRVA